MTLLSWLLSLPRPSGMDFCVCGHELGAHRHYRRGCECVLCGCGQFQANVVS